MNHPTRRSFVKCAAWIGLTSSAMNRGHAASPKKKSDVRIQDVSLAFEEFVFRTPLKFAGVVVDRQTMLTVHCTARTAAGAESRGFGSLPLNYTFTFPSKILSPETRQSAMKELAKEIARVTNDYHEFGHPIDINWELAPRYLQAATEVSRRLQLAEPIPKLCTLVIAGAFDAAIHDAFGKVHSVSSFHTYGPQFMNRDLGHYLGAKYQGEYPCNYVSTQPQPQMPICHMISAVDPITAAENTQPIRDGLPETLDEWINYNGLTYLKIKLNGDDLKWDVERLRHIDRVATQTQRRRGVDRWTYIPDFNEKCPHLDYFLAFLRQIQEQAPEAFRRIEYVEQPTHRDLKSHPENDMHEASKLCSVVIDESVIDVESVMLAREQGWTGVVVKSPKGLTHMLMIAAVAGKHKMRIAGGDMSCPGAALIQTASLQARLPGVTSIEANARQFLPASNKPWEARFPGMFRITDGMLKTEELSGPGLGA